MNKLTKIGVSALAGSLAAVSVNAAELTVAGSATLSYMSTDQENVETGNRFGSNSTMAFTASGDVNGYTVTLMNAISDTAGVSSHYVSVDMGDMGTITFDQGVGGNGFGSIDDTSPTAWEESWDATATAARVAKADAGALSPAPQSNCNPNASKNQNCGNNTTKNQWQDARFG